MGGLILSFDDVTHLIESSSIVLTINRFFLGMRMTILGDTHLVSILFSVMWLCAELKVEINRVRHKSHSIHWRSSQAGPGVDNNFEIYAFLSTLTEPRFIVFQ